MGKESEYPILEIYHPSISAGDAAVIVSRHKDEKIAFCVLIDLGCNTEEFIPWCQKNVTGFSEVKNSTFDYVIVSHYHTDHYIGVNHKSVIAENFISSHVSDKGRLKKELKRDYSNNSNNATNPIMLSNFKYTKGNINLFKDLGRIIAPNEDEIVEDNPDICFDLSPGKDKIITLTCICANGIYKNEKGVFEAHSGAFSDWNDHSIAWLLEYKGTEKTFRYFTAGDLSGEDTSKYIDIESKLIPYLSKQNKKVNVLKATHHGSKHSLTYNFLKAIQPDYIIVPCSNTYLLPFPQFFNRVQKLKDNNIVTSNILIANYMDFDIQAYEEKGEGLDDLKKLIKNKQLVTEVTIDDDSIYTAKKDENSKAELSAYLTTVTEKGESTTKSVKNIELIITAPSHGEQNLPELYEGEGFAEECFNLICKDVYLTGVKIGDFYIKSGSKYVQKEKVNPEKKKKLLAGCRTAFPSPKNASVKSIDTRFLSDPNEYKGKCARRNLSLDYLKEKTEAAKIRKGKLPKIQYSTLKEIVKKICK